MTHPTRHRVLRRSQSQGQLAPPGGADGSGCPLQLVSSRGERALAEAWGWYGIRVWAATGSHHPTLPKGAGGQDRCWTRVMVVAPSPDTMLCHDQSTPFPSNTMRGGGRS